MKRLSKLLAPVLVLGFAACAGEAYVVESSPPPMRSETVVYRPGHVFVQGHWTRRGSDWRWNNGYYIRERQNHVYLQPRWERRGNRYVYFQGEWRARGRVYGLR
ncbi:MAG: hypothetical protein M4D80_30310 [Myxococcota bacterium]|nr:YXWGXW repeat-containing protein [Deltaproteobacteria bacterium]MDQ3339481.1 hypothetical protein [Myxococcota bacterium]